MYLHIGNDTVINTSELIGVFDIEKTSVSKNTKDFLRDAGKKGRVRYVSGEMPKSFAVCLDKDLNETVYVTNISAATIKKRIESL